MLGEFAQVGDAVVDRKRVDLEIASVNQAACWSGDSNSQSVRDGVRHRNKLQVERAYLGGVLIVYHVADWLNSKLFALCLYECQGQGGAVERNIWPLAQQVRNSANVVLMAVGEHERIHLVQAWANVGEVRQNQVNAWLLGVREENTAIDEQQVAVVFDGVHVAADFAQTTESDDTHAAATVLWWRYELGVILRHLVFIRHWQRLHWDSSLRATAVFARMNCSIAVSSTRSMGGVACQARAARCGIRTMHPGGMD